MSKQVLIVEDSPTEALLARLVLEHEGYQVSLASDGKEGLAVAVEEQPDLIILDTILPRMSGYEAYQRLRVDPKTADIPVLMLLTESEPTDVPRRLGRGLDTYIAKPYAPSLLLAGVEEATNNATQAEEEHQEEHGFQEIAHTLGIGWVVLQGGHIVSANQAAERLFGCDRKELAGQPFADYLQDDRSLFSDMISHAGASGERQGKFKVRIDGEGETRWWRISAAPITYEDQAAVQLACLDVTDRIQAEEEIKRYSEELQRARQKVEEAKRARGDFLANMSHELRTPLYGFMGTIDLVLDTDLTPEQHDYLNTAKTSADALLAIVSDILEFTEIEAGQLSLEERRFDLWTTVEQTAEMIAQHAQEKGLEFSYGVAPDVPRALAGDPKRLRQVLSNLVSNAVKFTERGKVALWVEVEADRGEEVELHCLVRDTGIGIPEDKQQAIFEAFQQADASATRQYGGIGLRLDISRRLVRLMGGRLWVESEMGKGSTFHFTITLRCPEEGLQPPAQITHPAVEKTKPRLHILLAEDSPTNQLIAVANLKKAGHTVHVADNGLKAVRALEQEAFDLVLMDVAMPEMDGLEATQVIREREQGSGAHIPIIAMTAFATKEYRDKCAAAGMDDYVTKPVNPKELQRAIEQFLKEPDLGDSGKPPSSEPPVQLAEALEVVGGDVDLLGDVVEMSLEECPEQMDGLRDELARQDAAGVESKAHRLKGVLGNVGGLTARDVAQRLETMGEEGNLDGGMAAFEELKAEMERVVAFYSDPGWKQNVAGYDGDEDEDEEE